MILDTSAVMAILLGEPEAEHFARLIYRAEAPRIAAPNYLEAMIVAVGRFGLDGSGRVRDLLRILGVEFVPFDDQLAEFALYAFEHFGKGRHPAGLNYGDCIAYALARREAAPLLYKGTDFALTDIAAAA
jgi:ribonuclease VapC